MVGGSFGGLCFFPVYYLVLDNFVITPSTLTLTTECVYAFFNGFKQYSSINILCYALFSPGVSFYVG